jgi:SAM-dependent methyltransferase
VSIPQSRVQGGRLARRLFASSGSIALGRTYPGTAGMLFHYDNPLESDRWGIEIPKLGLYPIEERLFAKHLPAAPARILDLGCGGGREAIPLARKGYDVLGLDLSPRFVRIARQNARGLEDRARFEVGDVARMDLRPESFDAALMLAQLIGHIPGRANRVATLESVRRALRPDGVLIVSTKDRGARFQSRALFAVLNPVIRLTGLFGLEPNDLFVIFSGSRLDLHNSIRHRVVFHWHDARSFSAEARDAGFVVDRTESAVGTSESGDDHLTSVGDLFFVLRNPA